MISQRNSLKIALWVAIVGLVLAVIPIWPYGYYTLLRLVVSGVSLFALVVLGAQDTSRTVGLTVVTLLFNPFIAVELTRTIWLPIDLGVAAWFGYIVTQQLSAPPSNDEPLPRGPGAGST